MILHLGPLFLKLVVLLSLGQSFLLFEKKRFASRLHLSFFAGAAASMFTVFFLVFYGFVTSDFSLDVVQNHSHHDLPIPYKIAGIWSHHEGSMVVLTLFLSWVGLGFLFDPKLHKEKIFFRKIMGIHGLFLGIFALYILYFSNPFTPALTPFSGAGLNPLLEDPSLMIHPPFLLLGYASMSIPSFFAFAYFLTPLPHQKWGRLLYPWVSLGWATLTIGIALGSYWAYYELGWGGWWFWDPVENISLLPWLLSMALFHFLLILKKSRISLTLPLIISLGTFFSVLLGTLFVRTGLLVSVHSFAQDPSKGYFWLYILCIYAGLSLLGLLKKTKMASSPAVLRPRGQILHMGTFLGLVLFVTVFIGTFAPYVSQILRSTDIHIGPEYFHKTFVPLSLLGAFVMGYAPFILWQGLSLNSHFYFLMALYFFTILGLYFFNMSVVHLAGFLPLIWPTLTSLWCGLIKYFRPEVPFLRKNNWGMILSHSAFILMLWGMTVDKLFFKENEYILGISESVTHKNLTLTLDRISNEKRPTYKAQIAHVKVQNHFSDFYLRPERRFYALEKMITTKSALHRDFLSDTHIIFSHSVGHNQWLFRLQTHPFIYLIWLGAITLGGCLMVFGTRHFWKHRRAK